MVVVHFVQIISAYEKCNGKSKCSCIRGCISRPVIFGQIMKNVTSKEKDFHDIRNLAPILDGVRRHISKIEWFSDERSAFEAEDKIFQVYSFF